MVMLIHRPERVLNDSPLPHRGLDPRSGDGRLSGGKKEMSGG